MSIDKSITKTHHWRRPSSYLIIASINNGSALRILIDNNHWSLVIPRESRLCYHQQAEMYDLSISGTNPRHQPRSPLLHWLIGENKDNKYHKVPIINHPHPPLATITMNQYEPSINITMNPLFTPRNLRLNLRLKMSTRWAAASWSATVATRHTPRSPRPRHAIRAKQWEFRWAKALSYAAPSYAGFIFCGYNWWAFNTVAFTKAWSISHCCYAGAPRLVVPEVKPCWCLMAASIACCFGSRGSPLSFSREYPR